MKIYLSLLLVLLSVFSFAQPNNFPKPNLEGLKIGYLTKELNLNSDEAQKFWPVYYSYRDEIRLDAKDNKDDVIVYEEKVLVIRKKYVTEFKNILGNQLRANKVFLAEREFGNYIKREVENRQKIKMQRQVQPNN